ncbi:MAG: hypothetical protein E7Z65_05010 [Thermoplasmata archaeon]|nr:hypothetical protein [Thermoplasmata archaeon]
MISGRWGCALQSGRKKRIMIACVTFETTKVTEPVKFYEANRVHIIHYVRDPDTQGNSIYQMFYDRVKEIIETESNNKVEVIEHNERVTDFSIMLKTVLEIIQKERNQADWLGENVDIYVNISSGGSEYAAAAAIAAMMMPGTVPFSVGTKEYTVDDNAIKETYFVDGKPVGLTKTTYDPRSLPSYSIHIPEEHLVRGLRILHQRRTAHLSTTSSAMIAEFKKAGIWYRDTDSLAYDRSKIHSTEAVYYQRDFINKWVQYGWARKDEFLKKYVLTDQGLIVINTFYLN